MATFRYTQAEAIILGFRISSNETNQIPAFRARAGRRTARFTRFIAICHENPNASLSRWEKRPALALRKGPFSTRKGHSPKSPTLLCGRLLLDRPTYWNKSLAEDVYTITPK